MAANLMPVVDPVSVVIVTAVGLADSIVGLIHEAQTLRRQYVNFVNKP
ncbi:MAG: hypothetical protein SFV19_06070 [Rhodospirillaceae bacterium]|nr:hypothetical protein [Rhodospirillaceae bacterium]